MKEIPFFEAEDFSDDIVQEAVNQMLSIYHVKGYPFAQVAPVVTLKAPAYYGPLFSFLRELRLTYRKIIFPRQQPQGGQTEGHHVSQGEKKV